MAGGQGSNLGESSSSRAMKQKGTKRSRQNTTHGEEAKKLQRLPQLGVTAHPSGAAAVPLVPLQNAASNGMAMAAAALPMAGVNGAALRWSTAAALAAAGKAVMWSLPLPLTSYQAMAAGVCGPPAPAPAIAPPLVEALKNIRSDTLGRLLTAVMRVCDPPMLPPQSWIGASAPPPWWPASSSEDKDPENTPVPFAAPYKLRKEEKVAVLVSIVKHHAPDLDVFSSEALCEKAKLSNDPVAATSWKRALALEAARHNPVPMAPVVVNNLIVAPHGGDGNLPVASGGAAATEDVVVHGGVAGANGGEQGVKLAVAGASVTAPAADDGVHGLQVVAAAEPEKQEEQPSGGGAGANGGEQGVKLAVAGASVTAPAADDGVHGLQVVAAAEPEKQEEQPSGGGVLHDGGAVAADAGVEEPVDFLGDEFAAADMDQLLDDMLAPLQMQQVEEAQQAIDAEAETLVEDRWYLDDENGSFFDDFELLKDENGKNYLDYLNFV